MYPALKTFPRGLTRFINASTLDRLHMAQHHSAASADHTLYTGMCMYIYIYIVISCTFLQRPQVWYHLSQQTDLEMTHIRSKMRRAVFHSAKLTCLYPFDTSKSDPHGPELFNKVKSFLQQPVTSTCRCLQRPIMRQIREKAHGALRGRQIGGLIWREIIHGHWLRTFYQKIVDVDAVNISKFKCIELSLTDFSLIFSLSMMFFFQFLDTKIGK